MDACGHSAFAQVQALDAVLVKAAVAELERCLPARHLREVRDELGDASVLGSDQLFGRTKECVARKSLAFGEVVRDFFDHLLSSNQVYSRVFFRALRWRVSVEQGKSRHESQNAPDERSHNPYRDREPCF